MLKIYDQNGAIDKSAILQWVRRLKRADEWKSFNSATRLTYLVDETTRMLAANFFDIYENDPLNNPISKKFKLVSDWRSDLAVAVEVRALTLCASIHSLPEGDKLIQEIAGAPSEIHSHFRRILKMHNAQLPELEPRTVIAN